MPVQSSAQRSAIAPTDPQHPPAIGPSYHDLWPWLGIDGDLGATWLILSVAYRVKVKESVTQIEAHAAGTVKLQLAYQIS